MKKYNYSCFLFLLTLQFLFYSCGLFQKPLETSERAIGTITHFEQDKHFFLTVMSYSFLAGENKIEIKEGVRWQTNFIYYPEGAKFEVKYNPNKPEKERCIYLHKPVFYENTKFDITSAKVIEVFIVHYTHYCAYYGGLVLNYVYYVNGRKYVATSAFDLDKASHLFGDKMRHLRKGFKDNYFDVKYDVNNPALSRLVLDGVEE